MFLRLLPLLFLVGSIGLSAQEPDSVRKQASTINADDPSQFITRIEVFNELQYYKGKDFYINQAVVRGIVKLGKRFTTRIDVPFVSNSIQTPANHQPTGLGDISLRLLGYQLFQRPRSALTASIEMSFNTAESPILGTGKNVVIPMFTYSLLVPKHKMLFSAAFQQFNSVSGDEVRNDLSFSKLQVIGLRYWSRKFWTLLAPEWYYDYVKGGFSMNLRSRITHAPTPRMNIWLTPSVGVFGDFVGRYTWSIDIGGRYFLMRGNISKK